MIVCVQNDGAVLTVDALRPWRLLTNSQQLNQIPVRSLGWRLYTIYSPLPSLNGEYAPSYSQSAMPLRRVLLPDCVRRLGGVKGLGW